jgi:ATP phosphoribosyltransferase
MNKLKIAIQKDGRLSEKSLKLLAQGGIHVSNGNRKLKTEAKNFPLEVLFLRDDDIPKYVEQGIADVGIVGKNEVLEQGADVNTRISLNFASCRLCLAIPKEEKYEGLTYFNNKRIATSYGKILQDFFEQNNISADIENISGSVEIAPGIGLADGICDLVSTGSTLIMNGLKEVETVLLSQAILISNTDLPKKKQQILDSLIFRLKAVLTASANKYILLNAPNEAIEDITRVLPGMKSPTVVPLVKEGWSSLHSVVSEDDFWEIIDQLKDLGAEGILVAPIEKMIL